MQEYLFFVSLVCCQVEVFVTDRTPVQESHTDCDVCVCVGGGGVVERDQGHQ